MRACGAVVSALGAQVESIAFPEAAEALDAHGSGIISAVEACVAHQPRLGQRLQEYDPIVTYRMAPGKEATALAYLQAVQTCTALSARARRTPVSYTHLTLPTIYSV